MSKGFKLNPFKDKKCRNCFNPLPSDASTYLSYTSSGDRVFECPNCKRLNINRLNTTGIELVTRKEESTLQLKTPITKKNGLTLVGVTITLLAVVVAGLYFIFT